MSLPRIGQTIQSALLFQKITPGGFSLLPGRCWLSAYGQHSLSLSQQVLVPIDVFTVLMWIHYKTVFSPVKQTNHNFFFSTAWGANFVSKSRRRASFRQTAVPHPPLTGPPPKVRNNHVPGLHQPMSVRASQE